MLHHLILLSWSGTSAWQSRALLYVNTPDKDFTANYKGKNRGYTQCVWTIINAGRCSALRWRMEEFRQKGIILFWSFIQGFIYRGRMCCCLEGSVLAVGGECEAIRWVSICETPEGWKDCQFSPCKTPLRTLKSLSWAKDGTNQRKQQRHFNKHTNTYALTQCK